MVTKHPASPMPDRATVSGTDRPTDGPAPDAGCGERPPDARSGDDSLAAVESDGGIETWRRLLAIQNAALPRPLALIDRITVRATEWLLVLTGSVFTSMVTLEVISRYVFGFSIFLINAAASVLLIWFFLLGTGLALRFGAHVGFELLVNMLRPRPRRRVRIVMQVLALLFFAEMIVAGVVALGPASTQEDPALMVSLVWGFLAVPVGFTLMFYHMAIMLIGELRTPAEEGARLP